MEGIDYRNIIFPSIVITVITLILGLRVYLLLPLLSYIIRTIENFINENIQEPYKKSIFSKIKESKFNYITNISNSNYRPSQINFKHKIRRGI